MNTYLVFRLYGPMASWGQPAVGGERPTAMAPGRSAVLGVLGAALGIKRDQEDRLCELADSVRIAVKQYTPSSLVRDYHTAQVPSHSNKVTHRNRKSELSEAKLNTILSNRDYRCDGLWTVAVWLTDQTAYRLEDLQQALQQPVYPLYLGRKACPPALPLAPRVTELCELKQALDYEFPKLTASHKADRMWLGHNGWVTYFWEGEASDIPSEQVQTSHPWDEPVSRQRWQFTQRTRHQLSVREE